MLTFFEADLPDPVRITQKEEKESHKFQRELLKGGGSIFAVYILKWMEM